MLVDHVETTRQELQVILRMTSVSVRPMIGSAMRPPSVVERTRVVIAALPLRWMP